jgi:hypothetical protein
MAAPAQAQAPDPIVVGGPVQPLLRSGTEIPVRLMTKLTTKNKALRVGQRFDVETAEPIYLDGKIVIPVGTPGQGEITTVRNKGMWGKSGHFDLRLLYLRVGDRRIRLRGVADDKGVAGGLGAAAVSAIVFLPAGFFMTGTSAVLPAGTIVKGFLDEDVPVAFAAVTAPAPIVVGTPTIAAAPAIAQPAAAPIAPTMTPVVMSNVGPPKRQAKTQSGFCYDVPKGYAGTGSASAPMLTAASPACHELAGK